MSQNLETQPIIGQVYDCNVTSAYGHQKKQRGIYMGKITKTCHGLLFRANAEMSTIIKFTQMSLVNSVLDIRSPIEIYSREDKEEECYLEFLKQKGL